MGLAQLVLDPTDPGVLARYLAAEPLEYPLTGGKTGADFLIVTTTGDMNVPASGGVTVARAAGVVDFLNPDPRYGKPLNQVLLDTYSAEAVNRLKKKEWMKDCWVWLYRGAWQEWDIDQIEMAVPLSPEELMRKRRAVFKHQSQKDSAMFPGGDKREFWMRAEDRNHATAQAYNALGLAEYEAMEAFVRYKF